MPQKSFDRPFREHERIETSGPVSTKIVQGILDRVQSGVTIEIVQVQSGAGGGYLFHVSKSENTFDLVTYAGEPALTFSTVPALTTFINHASGLNFDEDSWRRSEEMNRRIEVQEGEDRSSTL